jgi:putative transposase
MKGIGCMKSTYTESLAHTTWECKYHIVFAPKFRRKEIYGALKREIGMILRELCRRKEVDIIEAEACPDHIHLYVSVPAKLSISSFVGYLKGKSTLIIFERHANLKYKYGNRTFWCGGYYVSTVGNNKTAAARYVANQLKEDMMTDQITIKNTETLLREVSKRDANVSGESCQTKTLKCQLV